MKNTKKIINEDINLKSFYNQSQSITGNWLTEKNVPLDVMKNVRWILINFACWILQYSGREDARQ